MSKRKNIEKYWAALDLLLPKHHDGNKPVAYCTDDAPSGSGHWGCKRCDVIVALEEKRCIKIWPRSVMTGSTTEWEDEKEVAKVHKVGFKKGKK